MNEFSINPNFESINFDNSIANFNKTLSNSMKTPKEELKASATFEEVFNSIGKTPSSDKKKALSVTAKVAQDIGNGFSESLNELNAIQRKTEKDIETFASGGDISIHEVMISAQKSSLSMQMAIQLRNQMLNIYNEFKGLSI